MRRCCSNSSLSEQSRRGISEVFKVVLTDVAWTLLLTNRGKKEIDCVLILMNPCPVQNSQCQQMFVHAYCSVGNAKIVIVTLSVSIIFSRAQTQCHQFKCSFWKHFFSTICATSPPPKQRKWWCSVQFFLPYWCRCVILVFYVSVTMHKTLFASTSQVHVWAVNVTL